MESKEKMRHRNFVVMLVCFCVGVFMLCNEIGWKATTAILTIVLSVASVVVSGLGAVIEPVIDDLREQLRKLDLTLRRL